LFPRIRKNRSALSLAKKQLLAARAKNQRGAF
jgi:hypothetical protein